jgi:hypothetical protein
MTGTLRAFEVLGSLRLSERVLAGEGRQPPTLAR